MAADGSVAAARPPQAPDGTAIEGFFRRVAESSNEAIWVCDNDGTTIFANAKMADLMGYSLAEMAHMTIYDLLDQQGKAQASDFLERQRQQATSETVTCSYLRADGARIWAMVSHSPLLDEAGRHVGSISVVIDITDRQRVDEELRRREVQLGEAQRVAHLGSWEWDIVANELDWSDETYRIFGLQPQEFGATYEAFLQYVHADDVAMLNQAVNETLQSLPTFELQYRIVRPSDEVLWVHARGELVRDETGTPQLMRGTLLDITTNKTAERALRHTSARYRLLKRMATAANEASSVTEALQLGVDEICAHTGWPIGHVYRVDHDPHALVPVPLWHLREPEQEALALAVDMTGPAPATAPAASVLATGRSSWMSELRVGVGPPWGETATELGLTAGFAFPVLLGGDVVAVLEFLTDDPVEPDEALLETLAQVGTQLGRVIERQRASDDLTAARDAAMEASRLKSEFLSTVSHEIRTPMNGVIGLTGLLLDTRLDDQQRRYAEGVQGAGEALLAIINDILDFSKIEAGRLELEELVFDVAQVVEEAAGLMARQAQEKGLELVAYGYLGLPTRLSGDPTRLRQVLLNLTSNAVKFTEAGEVVLRTRLVEETESYVVVGFEVADTGVGIAEADQHQLFEAFSQVDASTTRRFGGTGLGLAISHQLVAAMGGDLRVDSEPGKGSTFHFALKLPRCVEDGAAERRPTHDALNGLRVLVVDDNATNRLIMQEQLSAWEMEPDLASDGAALEKLLAAKREGQPFEIALLDMRMPSMNGLELARHICADPTLAATRLVLLTSTGDEGMDEIRQAGFAAHLTKPVRSRQLYDCLGRLAGQEREKTLDSRLPSPIPGGGSHARVLVAEDNATNQMVARGILARLGYRVDVVANGLEALQSMTHMDYAAVLMDCQMPEMDGYTATGEIRRRQATDSSRTPVIAMTAGGLQGDRERCVAAGMDDYISKPVKAADLAAVLARWIPATPIPSEQS